MLPSCGHRACGETPGQVGLHQHIVGKGEWGYAAQLWAEGKWGYAAQLWTDGKWGYARASVATPPNCGQEQVGLRCPAVDRGQVGLRQGKWGYARASGAEGKWGYAAQRWT